MCLCLRARAHICEAPFLGSREAQLSQLSTLTLAPKSDGPLLSGSPWTPCSPAHCILGPRTPWMIYYSQRELSDPTSPYHPLTPSLFHPSSLLQPYYFRASSPHSLSNTEFCFHSPVLLFLVDSHFLLEFFLLISVARPFLLSGGVREHKDTFLSHVFLILLLFFYVSLCSKVRISACSTICNS